MISVEVADLAARRIAAKLTDLAAMHSAFGDDDPALVASERLDDGQLDALQARLGVALPEAYRALARHVGTTGAGPDLGLLGAGVAMPSPGPHGAASAPPQLQRPFPLERAWHPLDDDGAPRATSAGGQAPASHPYDGAMQLTELGDGCFTLLVLQGPHAGEVWVDLSAEGGPLQPVAPLLDWYEDWLDELLVDALVEAMGRAMPPGHLSPLDEIIQRWGHVLDDRATPEPDRPEPSGTDLAAQALWKLYAGRAAEADALIARLEALPPAQAAELPEGMCEALTLWSYADDAAAAMDPFPPGERLMAHRSWRLRRLLANNPATPALALSWLAGDGRLEVRCAVAGNPGASNQVLREALIAATTFWAARPDHLEALFVLDLLARHPGCTAEQLDRFAAWDQEWPSHRTAAWVVRGVAYNPAASAALITTLVGHAHPCVREAVARRRDASPAALTELTSDPDATVREAVAGNPATPVAALTALAGDSAERVRYRVAERAELSAALQRQLACDFATSVVLAVSERAHLDPSAAELLALRPPIVLPGEDDDIVHDGPYLIDSEPRALAAEASASAVPPLDLEIFLDPEHRAPADDLLLEQRPGAALVTLVTGRALGHPGYPAPLLTRQCREPEDLVGYAIAEHPWLEDAALHALAAVSYAPTRARIAARDTLPDDVVAVLLEDASPMVQRRLALRRPGPNAPSTMPNTMLERWAVSEVAETRAAAAASPHATAAVLNVLAHDREAFVRRAVAGNPAAAEELVTGLAADPDPEVRRAVTWRATVSASLVEALSRDADPDVRAWASWRRARDAVFAAA